MLTNEGDAGGSSVGGGGTEPHETITLAANDATAANAAVAEVTLVWEQPELDLGISDADSDITGTLSDGERDRMEIDKVVANIPKDQRDGVRAMLEKSKARRARQIQRRLKKPITEETGVPKNPKK